MFSFIQMLLVIIFSYLIALHKADNKPMDDVIVQVVVSHENYSLSEVNMEGNRYKFAGERQIEFKPSDWTHLILRPLARKTNLRAVESDTVETYEFIKEMLSRCVGTVDSITLSNDDYLVKFENWYDNHYTGFIRYYLNDSNKCRNDPLYMKVIDKYNNEHTYQLGRGGGEFRAPV
jgi:hypothetical protein